MNSPLPLPTIAAVATVVAALIAAAISFVSLTMSKEQKTSEFLQEWIDGLREDLAKFFAAARACARAFDAKRVLGENYSASGFQFSDDKVADLRHEAAEMLYRIKLRLSPDETEHIELMRLITASVAQQNSALTQGTQSDEVLKAIELAVDYSRPVLKAEWKRVKHGELPFRIVRNWVAPFIVILGVVFVIIALSTKN
jgi:hypothetical protein